MATLAATGSAGARRRTAVSAGVWTPAYSLWLREIVRFYRQTARVVGVLATPLLFWVLLGSGFARSFHTGAGSESYLRYFFPGSVVMIVLFTAIFSMMSLIQDRNEGFLLSVMAAPVSRSAIVLGKVLGGATLAAIQGIIFLVFTPLVGIHPDAAALGWSALVIVLISFELTALGFAIAWPMDSPQAFHAIVNVVLLPLWMLSGALFPADRASGWLGFLMRLNPLSYGVDALRNALFPGERTLFSMNANLAITAVVCAVMFGASWAMVNRRTGKA